REKLQVFLQRNPGDERLEILERSYILDGLVFDADVGFFVACLVFFAGKSQLTNGELERVDALEFRCGRAGVRAGFPLLLAFLKRLEVGLAVLVLDDVQFAEVEPHEGQMDFAGAKSLEVVLNQQFGNIDEYGVAEFGRVDEFEVLDGQRRVPQADENFANHHGQAGLLPDLSFGDIFCNRIEEQDQEEDQQDQGKKQPEEPLEKFIHAEFVAARARRDNGEMQDGECCGNGVLE